MDILYQLQELTLVWDENKAFSNLQKHEVTFKEAAEAFFDPFYQLGEAIPVTASNFEQRNLIIGYSLEQRFLFVVFLERTNKTRIISARLATRNEKKIYEQA